MTDLDLDELRAVAEAIKFSGESPGDPDCETVQRWIAEGKAFDDAVTPSVVLALLNRLEHHRETLRLAVELDANCDLDMDVILKREPWLFEEDNA